MKRIFPLLLLVVLVLLLVPVFRGADSAGIWGTTGLTDSETGKPAHLKLRDNLDGTKSLVVFAVIVTPSPTYTPTNTPTPSATYTPTATSTATATATATATFTPTPTP